MRALRVALVGVGAVGSETARNLGAAGVGEVLFIDPDRVEERNLRVSDLYRGRVGQPKAIALAEALGPLFAGTRWAPLVDEVADVGWARLRECDVILSAVDRDSARLEIARIATRLGRPVCEAGLSTAAGGGGRVTWYPARAGAACFGCRLTALRRREMLTSWRSSVHPCLTPPVEAGGWEIAPLMAARIAALQVETALAPRQEAEAFSQEMPVGGVRRIEHRRSEECPFHETPAPMVEAAKNQPFSTFLGEMAMEWEWSICQRAACLDCGHRWTPRQRVARVLRDGRCPGCAGARVRIDASTRRVEPGSALAQLSPEEIGLPPDHLYTMVTSSTSPEAPQVEASE